MLGAGAVGGYFGARLVEAGVDTTFLVRPARRRLLAEQGLRVFSPLGDANLVAPTVVATELRPEYDFVLLTCKAYDLDSAMDAIAPAISPRTAIVPLLNGLAHLDRLDARFGVARVMGGTCMIDSTLQADGSILHGGTLQRLVFGERDRSHTPRALALQSMLAAASFDTELADDIVQRLWDKLVFLSALAATTCLFRANVGEINSAPGGPAVMARALAANVAIATAEGHAVAAAAIDFAQQRLTDRTGSWSASLLRDLEAGGRIEGDHIVGWMLDRARRHGVDDVVLGLAFTALKAYEARRDSGRLAGPAADRQPPK